MGPALCSFLSGVRHTLGACTLSLSQRVSTPYLPDMLLHGVCTSTDVFHRAQTPEDSTGPVFHGSPFHRSWPSQDLPLKEPDLHRVSWLDSLVAQLLERKLLFRSTLQILADKGTEY